MLMTVKEVQQKLNVSRALVYRLVERGELACHRIGKSIRISQEDLETFLRQSKVEQLPSLEVRNAKSRLNNLEI